MNQAQQRAAIRENAAMTICRILGIMTTKSAATTEEIMDLAARAGLSEAEVMADPLGAADEIGDYLDDIAANL